MKMICDACGHTAPPADVWVHGEKVALECARCGALDRVTTLQRAPLDGVAADVHPATPQAAGTAGAPSPTPQSESIGPDRAKNASIHAGKTPLASPAGQENAEGDLEAVVAASPAVAPGVPPVQCPKCGARQHTGEACHRCGFTFANHRPGEMDWDQPAEGKVELWEEAERRWAATLEAGTTVAHEAFAAFCIEHELEEPAGRKLRFRLADRPDDHHARRQLEAMLERGRSRLTTRMELSREDTLEHVRSTRRTLFLVVFAIGVALALLLLSLYPNLLM